MAFISSGSRKVSLSTHTLNPSLGPSHTRVLPLPPLGGGAFPEQGWSLVQNQKVLVRRHSAANGISPTRVDEAAIEEQGRLSPQGMVVVNTWQVGG